MKNDTCANCGEYQRCRESAASVVFFLIGLIAIIAIRLVTILEHVHPFYGKLSWYVGVCGFIIYFAYKFKIDHSRSQLVKERGLQHKISHSESIGMEDRELIGSLLCALSSNKDRLNYFVIFFSSMIVLIIALYLDLIR